MRRPLPGILAIREEASIPSSLEPLLPSLAGMAGSGKQDMPQAMAGDVRKGGRAATCSSWGGAGLHAGGPQGRPPSDLRSYFDPVRPGCDPWRDESRRPAGGAPVASSLLQNEPLVACH